jgi:hypothetical protein
MKRALWNYRSARFHVSASPPSATSEYSCEQDLAHEPPATPLPEAVTMRERPLLVVGAMAGG